MKFFKLSIFFFAIVIFACGCAAISQSQLASVHVGMDKVEVKKNVGFPLFITPMRVIRDGKVYKTSVEVWEYRNLFQAKGTLCYFYNNELMQIEQGYIKSRFWPPPKFEYD